MPFSTTNAFKAERIIAWCVVLLVSLTLLGCGSAPVRRGEPLRHLNVSKIRDATPRAEPLSPYGNPDTYEVNGKVYHTLKSARGYDARGIASWYGPKFNGKRTSSGETYDMYQMTAAHKTLPLPSYVRVTNLQNGRSAVVKVNDRGPFKNNRIIDLSYAAALKIGIVGPGTGLVEVQAVDPRAPRVKRAEGQGNTAPEDARGPVAAAKRFFLQVGAFVNRDNAERLRNRLAGAIDRTVAINEGTSSGRSVYRVWIGPLVSVDVADRLVQDLAKLGIDEHHVVVP